MTLPLGLYAYVGAPRQGKTTLAIREQAQLAQAHGLVPLTIDSVGALNWQREPHAKSIEGVLELVWGQARPTVYTPRDQEELDTLARAIQSAKRVALLIDEFSTWRVTPPVDRLLRTWAHAQSAVLVTAHHVTGDLGQRFLSLSPKMRVFQLTAPVAVEFFMRWKGIDPGAVRGLKVGEHLDVDL